MKTSHLIIIIILGIVIIGSVMFAIFYMSPFEKEHYEIEITGMKDIYLVGEQYDFSYVLSGYGQSCGSKTIHSPDEDGKHIRTFYSASCAADTPMKNFVYDVQKEQGTTYGHVKIKNPGWYNVIVELNYENVFKSHEFFVVDNNCDDLINDKSKAQCLAKSHESCTSAYMTQQFPSEEDSEISLVATVQSWNDCQLTVHTLNSIDGHTSFNGIRSICSDMTVNDDSLNFENCNNADYPPIMFALQDSISHLSDTTKLVDKSSASICPDGINLEFDTQRRITSCGANPPQAKTSILEFHGIQTCHNDYDQIFYMNNGEKGSITYSYEITENKRNPDERFDLNRPPHFMCSFERGVWESCNPEGVNISYNTDKRYMSVNESAIITAEIQIDENIPTQSFIMHLSPNICANPALLFNILGDGD